MDKRRLLHIAILGAVPFIMVLGNSMLIPVLPQLQEAMGLTQLEVALLITLFSAPAAVVIPFAGIVSDHVGRRKVIAPALLVYGLGGLIAGAAALLLRDPYPLVLAGRVVQGIGAGGTYLLAVALAGDIFAGGGRTRVLGILEAANGAGKVVSPVLGAAVGLISWWAPFFVYGVLAIPAGLLVWFLIEEPPIKETRNLAAYGRALVRVFRERGVPLAATYLAGMAMLFLLFGVLSTVSDQLGPRYGIRGFAGGLVLAIPVGTMAGVAYVAGSYFQDRWEVLKPAILAGAGLAAASLAAAAVFEALVPFMAALGFLGVAIGAMLPAINMLVTSAARREERGLVTSLYGAVRFIGVAVGPPAFAMAIGLGRPVMFGGAAALAGLVLVLAWWLIKPDKLLVATGQEGAGSSDTPGSQAESTGNEASGGEASGGKEREGTPGRWRELEEEG
ncbi:MAG: MFS transporter [Bacillota bacterium]|nr:MFS transporter [Bacillota bacterium]